MNAIHKTTAFTCPCCRGFIGEAAPLSEVAKLFGGHRLRILQFFSEQVGQSVGIHDIENHLFNGRSDGGPDQPGAVVHVELSRLRKAIEGFGWTIVATTGRRSLYRLIPMEVGQ